MPSRIRSHISELPRHALNGLLALTLFYGLCVAVALHGSSALAALADGLTALFAGIVGLAFAFAFWVASRPRPLPVAPFLLGAVAATLLLHAVHLALVRPELVSDFRAMWIAAKYLAYGEGLPQAVAFVPQRALPVLTPLVAVFGGSGWVYKTANVLLLVASSLLYYDVLRRHFGHRVGQAFLVLFSLPPELYFASAITSHDVSGLFFLSACFWATAALHGGLFDPGKRGAGARRWLRAIGLSLLLGLALLLLEIQRSVSSFFLLALALVVTAEALASALAARESLASWGRRTLLACAGLLVVPFLVLNLGVDSLADAGVVPPRSYQQGYVAKNLANFGGSFSPGTFGSHIYFRKHFLDPMSHDEIADLARHEVLSDFYYDAPSARPRNYLRRARKLFRLGSQDYFYFRRMAEDSPFSREQAREPMNAANEVFVWAFAVTGVAAVAVLLLLVRPPLFHLLPLTYLGVLIAVLLLVGENQPRYAFPIWMIVGGAIALAAARVFRGGFSRGEWTALPVRALAGPALAGVVLVAVWLGVRATYTVTDGRIVGVWDVSSNTGLAPDRLEASFEASQLGAKGGAFERAFGSLVTTLKLPRRPEPRDHLEVAREICSPDPRRRAFSFFHFSPEARPVMPGAFELSVRAGDRELVRLPVDQSGAVHSVRLEEAVQPGECTSLRIRLTTLRAWKHPLAQRASTVHVYFPRLVE